MVNVFLIYFLCRLYVTVDRASFDHQKGIQVNGSIITHHEEELEGALDPRGISESVEPSWNIAKGKWKEFLVQEEHCDFVHSFFEILDGIPSSGLAVAATTSIEYIVDSPSRPSKHE